MELSARRRVWRGRGRRAIIGQRLKGFVLFWFTAVQASAGFVVGQALVHHRRATTWKEREGTVTSKER
jgi:hypothetical protein